MNGTREPTFLNRLVAANLGIESAEQAPAEPNRSSVAHEVRPRVPHRFELPQLGEGLPAQELEAEAGWTTGGMPPAFSTGRDSLPGVASGREPSGARRAARPNAFLQGTPEPGAAAESPRVAPGPRADETPARRPEVHPPPDARGESRVLRGRRDGARQESTAERVLREPAPSPDADASPRRTGAPQARGERLPPNRPARSPAPLPVAQAEAQRQAPEISPVRVSIGRVEVTLAQPPAPAPPPAPRARPCPAMSLAEYLARRQGGKG